VTNGGKSTEQGVRKSTGPIPTFYPQQEQNTYQRERKEVLGEDLGASTSSMPQVNDCVVLESLIGKVSTLRELLRSCTEIMKDETVLNAIYEMIDPCTQERETPIV